MHRHLRGAPLRAWVCGALLVLGSLPRLAAAGDLGPQGVVRQFCQLDATGVRASAVGWNRVAPLVAWPVEPAWDQVLLIDNYEVAAPRPLGDNRFSVEVRFRVVAEISGVGAEPTTYLETVPFVVGSVGDGRWVILGPPIPPHVLALQTHVPEVVRTLSGQSPGFLSASLFVARLLQVAGWPVAELPVTTLSASAALTQVVEPVPGDLIVYAWDGTPYHVGLIDAEGAVVSSTLSHGIVRTSPHAFPGDAEFFRLAAPLERIEERPELDDSGPDEPLDLPLPRRVAP